MNQCGVRVGVKACRWVLGCWALVIVGLLVSCGKSGSGGEGRERAHSSGSGQALRLAGVRFEDVTHASGLSFVHQLADGCLDNIMESDGAGGTFLDADGDGWMDVYLVNSGPAPVLSSAPPGTERWPNRLLRNRGDGTFEDVTMAAGVAGYGFGTTAASADYDNDGWADLLVVNFDGLILYHNEGGGRFADVTERAGLTSKRAGISAAWLDADGDGYLDVCVANYLVFDPAVKNPPGTAAPYPGPLSYAPEFNVLYRNRGDGTFEDISEKAGIRIPGHRAMSVSALDYDGDGDEDLYVSNDGTANLLLANDGSGRFQDVGLPCGVGVNQFGAAEGSMGAAVGDVNGDGWLDLFVTRFGNASLYMNGPGGLFTDRIQDSGILPITSPHTGWGGNFLDADNDGDLDLFIANGDAHSMRGMPALWLENRGDGVFRDARESWSGSLGGELPNARGSGAWDYDNDGRMDVLLTTLGGPALLWRNNGAVRHHWLKVRLVGTQGNRDSLGARVEVTAAGRRWVAVARCPTSYLFQQDSRLHFGLGEIAAVDRVSVVWPGGASLVVTNPAVDRVMTITEPGLSRWEVRR